LLHNPKADIQFTDIKLLVITAYYYYDLLISMSTQCDEELIMLKI